MTKRGRAYLLLFHTDTEVTLIELIGNVPSQGSKLPPLLHQSMEETQSEEKLAPNLRFVAALEEGGVRNGVIQVGSEEVGPQPFGRLISHLHPCRRPEGELTPLVSL